VTGRFVLTGRLLRPRDDSVYRPVYGTNYGTPSARSSAAFAFSSRSRLGLGSSKYVASYHAARAISCSRFSASSPVLPRTSVTGTVMLRTAESLNEPRSAGSSWPLTRDRETRTEAEALTD
jgi:hypothetical protein